MWHRRMTAFLLFPARTGNFFSKKRLGDSPRAVCTVHGKFPDSAFPAGFPTPGRCHNLAAPTEAPTSDAQDQR